MLTGKGKKRRWCGRYAGNKTMLSHTANTILPCTSGISARWPGSCGACRAPCPWHMTWRPFLATFLFFRLASSALFSTLPRRHILTVGSKSAVGVHRELEKFPRQFAVGHSEGDFDLADSRAALGAMALNVDDSLRLKLGLSIG